MPIDILAAIVNAILLAARIVIRVASITATLVGIKISMTLSAMS